MGLNLYLNGIGSVTIQLSDPKKSDSTLILVIINIVIFTHSHSNADGVKLRSKRNRKYHYSSQRSKTLWIRHRSQLLLILDFLHVLAPIPMGLNLSKRNRKCYYSSQRSKNYCNICSFRLFLLDIASHSLQELRVYSESCMKFG